MSKETTLKLGDRIQMSNILPAKDSFERLLIRESILDKTKLLEVDVQKHEVKTVNGSINWTNNDIKYAYDFTPEQEGYIRENLKTLSDKKELGADSIDLYKTFVNG